MASFEEVGIRFLSPSSVENYNNNPAFWVTKHLLGVSADPVPSMIRAGAVRAAVVHHARGATLNEAEDLALRHYDQGMLDVGGGRSEAATKEQDAILPMFHEVVKALQRLPRGKFVGPGVFNTVWLDGIGVPFMTKPDLVFERMVVDISTTHAVPSAKAKPKHIANGALHILHRGTGAAIIYASMKKGTSFEIEEADAIAALGKLRRDAAQIQGLIEHIKSAQEALSFLPLNPGHFLWSEKTYSAAALAVDTPERLRRLAVDYGDTYGGESIATQSQVALNSPSDASEL